MASLADIRAGIKTTIESNVHGLHVYANVPDDLSVTPCLVVTPGAQGPNGSIADFDMAMGRGLDVWNFNLFLIVSASDPDIAQSSLDEYVTGAGSKSIRQAVFENRDLGLTSTDAHVSGVSRYDMQFDFASISHTGALMHMTVSTAGTS